MTVPDDRRDGEGKPALVVSACLLGVACNHEGSAARRRLREALEERYRLVPVCPEVLGGLTTPRPAAEIQGGSGADVLVGRATVADVRGEDVTAAYLRGAGAAVAVARAVGAARAVLKARSPSCGARGVYDGTFSGTLADGEGVTAAALRAAGLVVTSEEDDLP
jgi:uncharacterized protein YbbK (DUF523 family)